MRTRNAMGSRMGAWALGAVLLLPIAATADDGSAGSQSTATGATRGDGAGSSGREATASGAQAGTGTVMPLLDVEKLNDEPTRYVGQRVSVAGELQEWLDARAFVLESGGIFDDEMTVIVPKDAKGMSPRELPEDADIVVTGTVRSTTLVEIERELGWDLDPELEIEFDGTRTYLVAERIAPQRDAERRGSAGAGE